MLIHCEKCSTTYELEERLIPPGGAPVQCSRCEHVFRAYPPSRQNGETATADGSAQREVPFADAAPQPAASSDRRGGLELVPPPADDLPVDAAPPVEPTLVAAPTAAEPEPQAVPQRPAEVSGPTMGAASAPARTPPPQAQPPQHTTYKPPPGPVIPPGKPVRKVPNPELEGTAVPSVAPMPRRGMTVDVGARKRSNASWIVWGAVALLGFLIVAGTFSWWSERSAEKAAAQKAAKAAPSRAMTRERQEGLKLLMRDDAASVERAAAQLDSAVRRDPASAARADRALALALLAQQARDQAEREESRARALEEERTRAAETRDGAARAAELAVEAETAKAEVEPLRERAGRLLSEARAELDAVPAELASDVSAARARVFVQIAADDREAARKTAAAAPAEDPWIALAAILAEAPQAAGGDAQQADRLEQLAAKHPEFVRPRLLAARIRAGLGDGERAIANVDAVLGANPQHTEARRLRAAIAPIPEVGTPRGTEGDADGAPPPSQGVNGHSHRGNGAVPPKRR